MTDDEGQCRPAAILAADVAGRSRLMSDDERAAVWTLKEHWSVTSCGRVFVAARRIVLGLYGWDCAVAS